MEKTKRIRSINLYCFFGVLMATALITSNTPKVDPPAGSPGNAAQARLSQAPDYRKLEFEATDPRLQYSDYEDVQIVYDR